MALLSPSNLSIRPIENYVVLWRYFSFVHNLRLWPCLSCWVLCNERRGFYFWNKCACWIVLWLFHICLVNSLSNYPNRKAGAFQYDNETKVCSPGLYICMCGRLRVCGHGILLQTFLAKKSAGYYWWAFGSLWSWLRWHVKSCSLAGLKFWPSGSLLGPAPRQLVKATSLAV